MSGRGGEIAALLALAAPCLLAPPPARAGCTLSVRCAAASGIPAQSLPYPTRAACESDMARGRQAMARQGGGCSYSCACSGGEGGAGPGAADLLPRDRLVLDFASMLGAAIGSSLFPGDADEAARRARAREQVGSLRRRFEAEEEGRRGRLESDRSQLLAGMKGGAAASAGWKGSAASAQLPFKFDEYLRREAERREVFERSSGAWCRLHAPLHPQRPVFEIDAGQWDRMLAYYRARKSDWDRRCNDPARSAGQAPEGSPPRVRGSSGAGRAAGALPMTCSDCWSAFDRESRGCGEAETNLAALACVNDALDRWTLCMGGCRAETSAPAAP